jgi:hypothetical protein
MAYREESAALNVAALLGLIAAWPVSRAIWSGDLDPVGSVVFGTAVLAALALAAFAAWRDPVLFAKHALTASLFVLGFCVLGWLLSDPGNEPRLATALAGVAATASLAAYVVLPRRGGPLPEVLLGIRDRGPVLELDGVRVAFAGTAAAPAGQGATVAILLENCWSGPRDVTLDLTVERGPSRALRVPSRLASRLEGGEVKRADFAWQAPAHAPGRYAVRVHVTVAGRRGRRVRPRRAREFENKVSGVEQLTYLAAGAIVWGGGLYLHLIAEPEPSGSEGPWDGRVAWTSLWPPAEQTEPPRRKMIR